MVHPIFGVVARFVLEQCVSLDGVQLEANADSPFDFAQGNDKEKG
jgi:hypothetical protein